MKSKIEMYVAQEIRNRRNNKKMSQRYIADCLNVSQPFIQQMESPTNERAFNLDHLNELAKILGCSPRDFLPKAPL